MVWEESLASLSLEPELKSKLEIWMKWDKCSSTRKEVEDLTASGSVDQLKSQFLDRVTFGTAGMRAEMAAGFGRLNELVYIQAAQGILKYSEKVLPNFNKHGVVVGYDGRLNSEMFARRFASVFLHAGVKVHFLDKVVATPLVSFAVAHCGAMIGAMITASHNPKRDNGLKVYWANGAQIVPPHDSNISESILQNLEPWSTSWDDSILATSPQCSQPLHSVFEAYKSAAVATRCFTKSANAMFNTRFAFAAFHGVGFLYVPSLLEAFGFNPSVLVSVKEMEQPDGHFPLVKFPNPEEGAPVWKVPFKAADEAGCHIILAVDPDADRFQVAEKQGDEWRIFTGNEIGTLMSWWLWRNWRVKHPEMPPSNVCMINSTVSSKFMKTMAAKEGFDYHETLTGFKWMGNKAIEQRALGKYVLLAFEESIGFMCGEWLDKDGVLATAIFAEFLNLVVSEKKTIAEKLDELYQEFGYHLTYISYVISRDQVVSKAIFERLRNWDGKDRSYPEKMGEFNVRAVRDLTIGYDSAQPDGKPLLPVSTSSQMITFTLEGGNRATIRGSGTEPKIKFYIEVITQPGAEKSAAEAQLTALREALVRDYIRPDVHGLQLKEE